MRASRMPEAEEPAHAVRHDLVDHEEKASGNEHHQKHHRRGNHGLLAARPGDARGLLANLLNKLSDTQFRHSRALSDSMAGVEGLEPPTPGFGDRCSTS